MKRLITLSIALIFAIGLSAQNLEDLDFGTDSTLDIVTWNIEWFPKEGATTVEYVKEIIQAMEADVIAVQEIDDYNAFVNMMDELEDWEGISTNTGYLNLGYIYNPEFVQMNSIYQILPDKNRELPRKPLVLEISFMGQDYVLINNHLKCCGDGYMNLDDPWDEETRRYDACVLLDEYIHENFDDQNVILLGDLNDLLTDNEANNVFQVFFNDPFSYSFSDLPVAEGPSADWSYPSWPSHLDHILISNELFDEFEDPASACYTIKIDDYLENGFWEYEGNVSDHRPVGLRLLPQQSSSVFDNQHLFSDISISPNPSSDIATLQFQKLDGPANIEIRNIAGQLIWHQQIKNHESEIQISTSNFEAGTYIVQLISGHKTIAREKLVKLD
jgi:endonuclease/exonuclease/phosphatase family metal-dependent hydrolase